MEPQTYDATYIQPLGQSQKSGDFWEGITWRDVFGGIDKAWTSDEERLALQNQKADIEAKKALAISAIDLSQTQARTTVQMALIGLGALALVGGGFLAFKAMKK